MEIVYDDDGLARAMAELAGFGSLGKEGGLSAERPVLVDRFLEDAIEVDVDAIRDATGEVVIGGVMEHVEEAGVHSGDSACVLPPPHLSAETIGVIEDHTRAIAAELDVRGLINVQYAVKANQVFVIEANPRACRTVPFVAKATGVPLAKVAARVMAGATLAELRAEGLLVAPVVGDHVAVKEAVLPFGRFPDADAVLGPEMRSTGEVMGIDLTFGLAFAKSQLAAGNRLPESGTVFLSLADRDKAVGVAAAAAVRGARLRHRRHLRARPQHLRDARACRWTRWWPSWASRRAGTDAVELIASGQVQLVVNSPAGRGPAPTAPTSGPRPAANRVPLLTTAAAGLAAAKGIADWARHPLQVAHASRSTNAASATTSLPARICVHASIDATRVGSVELPPPGHDRVGHVRPRRRAGPPRRPGRPRARWWSSRCRPSRGPATRRRGCTRRRRACSTRVGLQGPGVAAVAGRRAARRCSATGATVVASIWGRTRRRVPPGRGVAGRRARPGGGRRGQPVVPEPRAPGAGRRVEMFAQRAGDAAEVDGRLPRWPADRCGPS